MLTEKDKVFVYVPEGYSGTLDAAVYYPGAGGAGNLNSPDSQPFLNYIESNPDKVVVICKDGYNHTDDIYHTLDEVKENNKNISFRDVNFYSHSAGQTSMVDSAAASADYGYNCKYMTVLDGAYSLSNINITPQEAEKLRENGTTAIFFDESNYGRDNNLKALTNAGVKTMYVQCDIPNTSWDVKHETINAVPINNGLIDMLSGDINTLKDSDGRIKGYNYFAFNGEKRTWDPISKEQFDGDVYSNALIGKTLPYHTGMTGQVVNLANTEVTFDLSGVLSNLGTGSSVCIHRDELDAFLNSAALNALTNDSSDASSLSGLINSFKNNGILHGDIWNLSYEKLGIYDEALSARMEAANELGQAIREAINELQACMTEYEMIDTSELPQIQIELSQAEAKLSELEGQKIKTRPVYNEKYEIIGSEEYEDAAVVAAIEDVQANITEIKKLIDAINKLQETYDRVIAKIEEAMAKVNSFSNMVASINPSSNYVYSVTA